MHTSTVSKVVGLITAGALMFVCSPPANAATPELTYQSSTQPDRPLSAVELNQVAHDLELIFTVYVRQDSKGLWSVNYPAARNSTIHTSDLEQLATNLNAAQQVPSHTANLGQNRTGARVAPDHAFGSEAYKACVLDVSGLGLFTGLFSGAAGGFWSFIAAKRWADAAWVAARLVGTGALRGGVVGFAAALAGSAAWCATPWAR